MSKLGLGVIVSFLSLQLLACGASSKDYAYRSAAAPPRAVGATAAEQPFNTESYDKIEENDFRSVAQAPLSTFSIDVDTASYSNVRRFLRDKRMPPVDAVRIEELINYFGYSDAAPTGDEPVAVSAELSAAPWKEGHQLLRIGIRAKDIAPAQVPARNLVFLLDVSGSMAMADKLPLLKQAFGLLVEQLGENDRVSIVVYAGASGVVLEPTPGNHKDRIMSAVRELSPGGSTNGAQGIQLAYQLAQRSFVEGGINRVILATDGDFNVGVSSDGALERLIEKKRKSGVYLTVLGFGTGNLKDSKMEGLAHHGNGNYGYIDGIDEARKLLVREAGSTLVTVAEDVKVQVVFNPARVASYRLIGYENRALRDEDFKNDARDAGDMGAGHSIVALYELVPHGRPAADKGGTAPLKYQGERPLTEAGKSSELLTVHLRYKQPGTEQGQELERAVRTEEWKSLDTASEDFRFAAAVAGFGMLLRQSKHSGTLSWASVLSLGGSAVGVDGSGERRQFLGMVRAAAHLSGKTAVGAGATHTIAN